MDEPMRRRRSKWLRRRNGRLPAVLAAAVISGSVASVLLIDFVRRSADSDLRRLAVAVGSHRVTLARLTGGFGYGPCGPPSPNDSLVTGLICERVTPVQWLPAREL